MEQSKLFMIAYDCRMLHTELKVQDLQNELYRVG